MNPIWCMCGSCGWTVAIFTLSDTSSRWGFSGVQKIVKTCIIYMCFRFGVGFKIILLPPISGPCHGSQTLKCLGVVLFYYLKLLLEWRPTCKKIWLSSILICLSVNDASQKCTRTPEYTYTREHWSEFCICECVYVDMKLLVQCQSETHISAGPQHSKTSPTIPVNILSVSMANLDFFWPPDANFFFLLGLWKVCSTDCSQTFSENIVQYIFTVPQILCPNYYGLDNIS